MFTRKLNDRQRAAMIARKTALAAELANKPSVRVDVANGDRAPGKNAIAWYSLRKGGHAPPTGVKGRGVGSLSKKARKAYDRLTAGRFVRYEDGKRDLGLDGKDKRTIWAAVEPLRVGVLTGDRQRIGTLLGAIGERMVDVLSAQVPVKTGKLRAAFRFAVRAGRGGSVDG